MANICAPLSAALTSYLILYILCRPKNYKGSAFFLGGVVLVVWGWTFLGEPAHWLLASVLMMPALRSRAWGACIAQSQDTALPA